MSDSSQIDLALYDQNNFFQQCARHCDLNVDRAKILIKHLKRQHRGAQVDPKDVEEMALLERRWYDSLDTQPDYSVYADPLYFCDLWLCWIIYSRKYLSLLTQPKLIDGGSILDALSGVRTVLDVGCGAGYTTAKLKSIFPEASVYGSNFKNTAQYKMSQSLGRKFGFRVVGENPRIKSDLIFASEYFEHIQRPIEHLQELLQRCEPNYLLVANSFTSKAIGHFSEYEYNGTRLSGREISKHFRQTLKSYGFEKVKTKCWNDRPQFWSRLSISDPK